MGEKKETKKRIGAHRYLKAPSGMLAGIRKKIRRRNLNYQRKEVRT